MGRRRPVRRDMSLLAASGVVAGYGAAGRNPEGCRSRASTPARSSASSDPMVPASRRCSRPLPACCGRRPARVALRRRRHHRPAAARDLRASALAYVPQEFNIFPTCRCAKTSRSAAISIRKAAARRIDGVLARFPVLAREAAPCRPHAVRRRAPDAGHGDGADGGAARAAARRALGRPFAASPPSACSMPSRRSTRTASPSPSSSRTPTRRSPSPIAPTSWSTARIAAPGTPRLLPPIPKSEGSFSEADISLVFSPRSPPTGSAMTKTTRRTLLKGAAAARPSRRCRSAPRRRASRSSSASLRR